MFLLIPFYSYNKTIDLKIECLSNIMKDFKKIMLDNGIGLYYSRRNFNLIYGEHEINFGSAVEPANRRGLAHCLEHLTFKGSKSFPSNRRINKAAAKIGLNLNASTSFTYINYPIEVLSDSFPTAVEINADMMYKPILTNKSLEEEKAIILHELKNAQDGLPFQRGLLFNKLFFSNTPAETLVIGREEDIRKISLGDAINFHSKYCTPANADFYMIGGFNDRILKKTIKILERYPGGVPQTEFKLVLPKLSGNERVCKELPNINYAYVDIVFRTPRWIDEEQRVLPIIRNLLGGTGSKSLYQEIREEKKLAYEVGASLFNDSHFGNMDLHFSCQHEKIDDCISLSLNLIKKFNPSESDIEEAKMDIRTGLARKRDSPHQLFNMFISEEKDGVRYEDYEKQVMKTTKKDILDARNRYLQGYHQIAILRPKMN